MPEEHDEIVGAISHLPHIIAVALVNQFAAITKPTRLYSILLQEGSGISHESHQAIPSFGAIF